MKFNTDLWKVGDEDFTFYLKKAWGYESIMKGIPLSVLNLTYSKWLVKTFHKGEKVRVRYRGKRLSHPNHTLKSEATHFDVYVRRLI